MFLRKSVVVVAVIALALCAVSAYCLTVTKVSADEEQNWIRYTVPLPKSISIREKVVLSRSQVVVMTEALDDMIVKQAAEELAGLLGTKPEKAVQTAEGVHFAIILKLGGPQAEGLDKLKNSEQAYYIRPYGTDQLALIALKPAGLYYAAKTLQQLIAAKATTDSIEMPLVTVVDWPDLEDRGLWGSDNFKHLAWLADRKMNWMEQISNQYLDTKTGEVIAKIKDEREPLLTEGPQRAIKFVPVVLHLEQSSNKGPLEYYPQIKGKSQSDRGVMCYSQPKTVEIVSSWIKQLASLPHVEEVDVWLSENLGYKVKGCQCRLCELKKVDPMVLEARAVVKAWRMAQNELGRNIGLRVLTSEATEDFNTIIFSELPKEVKVIYYHSLDTYTCDKLPMMPRYLTDFAKSGRWVATCPNIGSIVGYIQPFESAQFINYRVSELVRNQASGILGYATPLVSVVRYNVEALAEYTWNVKGRSTREFAYSWAVRNGIKDPEKFADFRELVGRVSWNYSGDDWPMRALHTRLRPSIEGRLKAGTLPGFGEYIDGFVKCPFGAYPGPDQLERDVKSAANAVLLAQELGVEEFIQESRVAQGHLIALDALYELTKLIKDGKVTPENKAEATRQFQAYADGFRQSIDANTRWTAVFFPPSPGAQEEGDKKLPKPMDEWQELIDRMTKLANEFGIQVQ